jgi:hypothetical protein
MRARTPGHVSQYGDTLSIADHWFVALDQRQIGTGTASWVAQVLGVHREKDDLWVQIAPSVDPDVTIVLRLSPATAVDEALGALERRSPVSDGGSYVIDLCGGSPHSSDSR